MTSVAVGDEAEVKRLLEEGADPNQRVGALTPLMEAAALGNRELVQMLLDAGAKASTTDEDGWTPLMSLAIRKSGDVEVARMLIDAGANVCSRTDFEEFENARASDIAARSGHQPLADVLRDAERSCPP
jgi:ankyrin repeat protein